MINETQFEELVLSIGETNNTVSGPTEEQPGECCIYANEKDQLDTFAKTLKFTYTIIEEFEDGNGDLCYIVKLVK